MGGLALAFVAFWLLSVSADKAPAPGDKPRRRERSIFDLDEYEKDFSDPTDPNNQ